jgi:methionine aminopeptidase
MRTRNRARYLKNCARSSQEEHMVLITETGADVLTR